MPTKPRYPRVYLEPSQRKKHVSASLHATIVCSHQIVPAAPGKTASLLWTKGEQVEEAEVSPELGPVAGVLKVRIVRLHDGICTRPASGLDVDRAPVGPARRGVAQCERCRHAPPYARSVARSNQGRKRMGRGARGRVWLADFLGLCSIVISARGGSRGGLVGEPYFGSDVPRDSCCGSPEPDRKPRVNTSAHLSFRDSRCCCTRLANESQLTVRG